MRKKYLNAVELIAEDLIAKTQAIGRTEIKNGIYLNTQEKVIDTYEKIIAIQKALNSKDSFKRLDFTRYKFWIENDGANITFEGISDADDLAEFLRKKVIYVDSLQEKSSS